MTKKNAGKFKLQKERLKKILKQVTGNFSEFEGDLIPEVVIRGAGILYCFEPSTREFVKVNRGTKVFIIEEITKDKSLIYTYSNQVVEIETDQLFDIGFD